MTFRTISLLVICSFVTCAHAAESTSPEMVVNGSVAVVSDYIGRGLSQTWGKPALQASIEAAHISGVYAGLWSSTVSSQWVPGTHLETDWYAGFRNKLPGALSEVAYDLNLQYTYYPGGNFNKTGFALPASSPDTVEVYAAANYHWLTLKAGRALTKFYGWDTTNSAPGSFAGDPQAGVTGNTKGSYYLEANLSQDIAAGWTMNGQIGQQNIKNSTGLSWKYYKVGLTHAMDAWSLALYCTATGQSNAYKNFLGLTNNGSSYSASRPAVVLSLARNF